MKLFSAVLLILAFFKAAVVSSESEEGQVLVNRRYNGLKFGLTKQDYVLFKPRMEPLQESYSLCAWVKKLSSSSYPFWFAYGTSSNTNEITIDDGSYLYTMSTRLDLRSKVTDQIGTWRHVCVTWSLTSRTFRGYYDGVLLGSTTTPSGRKLGLDGYMVLGNEFDSYGGGFEDSNAFGGELFKVNMFDKELEASEVKEMADGGLCSEVEEKYGRSRYLKWEEFLLEEKSGNVTEIDVGCHPEVKKEDREEDKNSTEECDCEQGNVTTFSRWDLLRGEKFFNKTVSVEMVEELKQSWNILGLYLIVTMVLGALSAALIILLIILLVRRVPGNRTNQYVEMRRIAGQNEERGRDEDGTGDGTAPVIYENETTLTNPTT